jgi:hypothetical protein
LPDDHAACCRVLRAARSGGAVGTADRVGFGALAVLAIGISFGMARPQGATAMNRNCARAHQKTLTAD